MREFQTLRSVNRAEEHPVANTLFAPHLGQFLVYAVDRGGNGETHESAVSSFHEARIVRSSFHQWLFISPVISSKSISRSVALRNSERRNLTGIYK